MFPAFVLIIDRYTLWKLCFIPGSVLFEIAPTFKLFIFRLYNIFLFYSASHIVHWAALLDSSQSRVSPNTTMKPQVVTCGCVQKHVLYYTVAFRTHKVVVVVVVVFNFLFLKASQVVQNALEKRFP